MKIEVDEVYDISKRSAGERKEVAAESVDAAGMPRFAVKMLRDDLIDEEHSKGVIDLAVEARFLRRLAHPHIIAMRYVIQYVISYTIIEWNATQEVCIIYMNIYTCILYTYALYTYFIHSCA